MYVGGVDGASARRRRGADGASVASALRLRRGRRGRRGRLILYSSPAPAAAAALIARVHTPSCGVVLLSPSSAFGLIRSPR